ncbi:MAG: hypothetical protein AB2A00_37380 [Myxococcota bacterium]
MLAATMLGVLVGACTYRIRPIPVEQKAPPVATRVLVALLAPVDLRLQRGGVKTHERERVPTLREEQPLSRYPYPLDPWNRYGPPPTTWDTPEQTRLKPTGQLGTDEVLDPVSDAFAARLAQRLGTDAVRDASADPLAEQPDPARVAGFLTAYPAYDAVAWVEILAARAELPDQSNLNSLFTMISLCTVGAFSWLFLIPLDLDTPVEVRARAFLVRRSALKEPLAAAVREKRTVKARGSAGFDVDDFRADVAVTMGTLVGARLADELANRLDAPPREAR